MKKRLTAEGNETVTNCHGLKMTAADGKQPIFTILPELKGMTESPGPGTFCQANQPVSFARREYYSRPSAVSRPVKCREHQSTPHQIRFTP